MRDEKPWSDGRFAVVDLEGSGQQPPDIVELAVIHIDAGEVKPAGVWLVKPERPITARATRVHGIRNADVSTAPRFAEIQSEVSPVVEGRYFVAHNAAVDFRVLKRQLPVLSPLAVLDTLRLARALCPGRKSYALAALLQDFALSSTVRFDGSGPHRAGYDALAAVALFLHLVSKAPPTALSLDEVVELGALKKLAPSQQRTLF